MVRWRRRQRDAGRGWRGRQAMNTCTCLHYPLLPITQVKVNPIKGRIVIKSHNQIKPKTNNFLVLERTDPQPKNNFLCREGYRTLAGGGVTQSSETQDWAEFAMTLRTTADDSSKCHY